MDFQFEFDCNGVDGSRPLLYLWDVGGRLYIGKASRGSKRSLKHYARNVSRLLAGQPYRRGKPNGFRKVHLAMQAAVLQSQRIRLVLLKNVELARINEEELTAIKQYGCELNEQWPRGCLLTQWPSARDASAA